MGDLPRVVHVAPDPAGRGGMAAVVRSLLESPLRERYALDAIVTHRMGSRATRVLVSARGLSRLALWCARNRGGIVHIHSAVRGSIYRKAVAVVLARWLGARVIFHLHAGPGDIEAFAGRLSARRRTALARALRQADVVVSVSGAGADALRAAFDLPDVVVIANAAPPPPADPPAPVDERVLYLGGFEDPAKGGAVLVEALPTLLASDSPIELALAGPGEPPRELLAACGNGRVSWLGWLDESAKRRELERAAIVVLPSLSEGLPVVLLEAMGYGRAIVASAVGGIPEVVTDGVEGLLLEPGDTRALADALLTLVRAPERARALGAAGRARVARMSQADLVDRLDALYREVAAR